MGGPRVPSQPEGHGQPQTHAAESDHPGGQRVRGADLPGRRQGKVPCRPARSLRLRRCRSAQEEQIDRSSTWIACTARRHLQGLPPPLPLLPPRSRCRPACCMLPAASARRR